MIPASIINTPEDFDWQEVFSETSPCSGMPTSYPSEQFTFPPSPIYTDKQSPLEPSLQFDNYTKEPSIVPLAIHQAMLMRSPSTDVDTIGYPSPATSNSLYESSTSPQITAEQQSFTPSSPPPRRRGPGRPSKAQLAAEGIHGKRGRSVTIRREIHNDSAMRSRARFNSVLDQLWAVLPKKERAAMPNSDASRTVCRAEKIEIVIEYVKKLQLEAQRRDLF